MFSSARWRSCSRVSSTSSNRPHPASLPPNLRPFLASFSEPRRTGVLERISLTQSCISWVPRIALHVETFYLLSAPAFSLLSSPSGRGFGGIPGLLPGLSPGSGWQSSTPGRLFLLPARGQQAIRGARSRRIEPHRALQRGCRRCRSHGPRIERCQPSGGLLPHSRRRAPRP